MPGVGPGTAPAAGTPARPKPVVDKQKNSTQNSSTARGRSKSNPKNNTDGLEEIVVTGKRNTSQTEEIVVTSKRQEARSKTIDNNKLNIFKFPEDIDSSETPYVLFKIFKTVTGAVAAEDPLTVSLRKGAETVEKVYDATSAAVGETTTNVLTGASVGAAIGGPIGALIGAGVGTETGENFVDSAGKYLFGEGVNLTNRAKQLVDNFAVKRNIEQISDAIALFIPEGMNNNYSHEWNTVSVTSAFGLLGFAGQALSARNGAVEEIDPYIAEAAGSIIGRVLGAGEDFARLGLFASTGRTINPQLELLYSNPTLRTFDFEFLLNPKSKKESQAIKDIIYTFKYNAAPEIPLNSSGRYFIPPAQFVIEFYGRDNQINDSTGYLFKTKKCVLNDITINYQGRNEQFTTFTDDAPTSISLRLRFTETVVISKNDIKEGY